MLLFLKKHIPNRLFLRRCSRWFEFDGLVENIVKILSTKYILPYFPSRVQNNLKPSFLSTVLVDALCLSDKSSGFFVMFMLDRFFHLKPNKIICLYVDILLETFFK